MQSHRDSDHGSVDKLLEREAFLKRLRERADEMVERKLSVITGGDEDEKVVREWRHGDVNVRQFPDDEQSILRISVGGSRDPVQLAYCVYRGSHGKCVKLLRRVLEAMENAGR